MVVIVHVEKAIVLLCESTQEFRALMMISQYHKIMSITSMMLSQCPDSCTETSQVLITVLFQQSLYFPFQFFVAIFYPMW